MLRLGIIGAATYAPLYRGDDVPRTPGSFHGTAFASTYNGFDAAKASQWEWTFVRAQKRLDDARIVKVWDPDPVWAARIAEACFIDEVCTAPEECARNVDAVIIVDDGSGDHSRYAIGPLQHGVPVFCDKPIAMTARRAQEIAHVVRETGTPFMSASSLRFVPDIVEFGRTIDECGDVNLVTAACGNELVYYGIHALSMYYAVFGGGAVSCLNVGQPDRNLVRVRFECGRDLVLMVAEREYMQAGYQINVYGTKGWRSCTPNLADLYYYLQEQFVTMLRTGKEAVPVEQEVELIAVLEAGKRSLAEGREACLSELL